MGTAGQLTEEGLHTVHSILVDRLGGRIRLDSEPDVGTRVRCMLPRSAAPAN